MSRTNELRDAAILRAFSGEDSRSNCPMRIVEDYFFREMEENLKEGGYPVPNQEDIGFTDFEKDQFKWDRQMSELNGAGFNKPELEYPHDEFDVGVYTPKGRITETV